jgi:hypothetical protein
MNENKEEYFTYSVFDIKKEYLAKEKRRLDVYKKITSSCFKKIKLAVENEEIYCFYSIPEYIPGIPLFNMTDCVMFMLNELKDKGFNSRYVHPFMVYITWQINKPILRLTDKNKPPPKSNNILDNLNLKVKSVESYKPSGNFLYK